MSGISDSFQLLTSARYDLRLLHVDWNTRANNGVPTSIMLLRYHVDRLVNAAERHGWTDAVRNLTTSSLTSACEEAVRHLDPGQNLTYKMRVLLSEDGTLSATAIPLQTSRGAQGLLTPSKDPSDIRCICLDSEPTPASLFTSTKTTFRSHYNASRARVGLSPSPTPSDSHIDVLLYTPDGFLTETSIRNVAFHRNGVWVTPNASTGCLPGVVRRLLVEQGQWLEARNGELRVEDVREGDLVMTANSVEGCCIARVADRSSVSLGLDNI